MIDCFCSGGLCEDDENRFMAKWLSLVAERLVAAPSLENALSLFVRSQHTRRVILRSMPVSAH